MQAMKIFENKEFGKVRTVVIDNEPWFVGKDVAEALGYSNASKAVSSHVEPEDKQFTMVSWADSQNGNVPINQTKRHLLTNLVCMLLSSAVN